MYYPLFLDISKLKCLIVGAGNVGLRKAQGLLAAKAKQILVIDNSDFSHEWQELAKNPTLKLELGSFVPNHLQGCGLIFACTTDKELNTKIASLCAEQGLLCNCVDAPFAGNFIVPAVAKASLGDDNFLMAALSTEGASPAWARVLRQELEEWLSPHAPMTILLGRLRPLLLALNYNSEHNTQIFRSIVNSPLRDYLAKGNSACAKQLLQKLLPDVLHNKIMELLQDVI